MAVVRAGVDGRVHRAVLPDPRAGRAGMRRPPWHRESLSAGMARHPHTTLPRACATGFTPRPDIKAAPAGGTRAQAARRHDHRNTRHGAGRGMGGATARMAQPVARHARGTHLCQGRARGPPAPPDRNGGGRTSPCDVAITGWNRCPDRDPCSHSSIPHSHPPAPFRAPPTASRAESTRRSNACSSITAAFPDDTASSHANGHAT